jgi:hypothetical protein
MNQNHYIMKLTKISNNAHTLLLADGTEILFSYETPVAAFVHNFGLNRSRWKMIRDLGRSRWIKTEVSYSRTTSKHINAFLPDTEKALTVSQSTFDSLL